MLKKYPIRPLRRPCAAAAEALEPRRLFAATPTIVGDLNTGTEMLVPLTALTVGNVMYFTGRATAADGPELWKTDGTTAGTVQVRDVRPGLLSSQLGGFASAGGALYFYADDGVHGRELWRSDGSEAGTVMVRDVNPGTAASSPAALTDVNGVLYFVAENGAGRQIWRTDGTTDGTLRVTTAGIDAGATSMVPLNGGLLFSGGGGGVRQLDLATGTSTALGTAVGGTSSGVPTLFTFNGAGWFFSGASGTKGDLFTTDGTVAGTVRVKQIDLPGGGSDNTSIRRPLVSGNRLYFLAGDGNTGLYAMWMSDGTTAGTREVGPGGLSSLTFSAAAGANSLVTARYTSTTGYEPWVLNGDTGTWTLLKDTVPGPADGNSSGGVVGVTLGGTLYFAPVVARGDARLYKTDGTPGGTELVTEVPGTSGFLTPLGIVNGLLMLNQGRNFNNSGDLFRSDGTAAGTFRVGAATAAGNASSMISSIYGNDKPQFYAAGGSVYFGAADGAHGREVWRMNEDGTGAAMIADAAPGGYDSDPADFTLASDGSLYFTADTYAQGREVFRLPPGGGAAAAAQSLGDILPGPVESYPGGLTTVGDVLFFWAQDATGGAYKLRRYDPATGTPVLVSAAGVHHFESSARAMTRAGDLWYFIAAPAATASGTGGAASKVYKLNGAAPFVPPLALAGTFTPGNALAGAADGTFYFTATTTAAGTEIWKATPGSAAAMLADLTPGTASTSVSNNFLLSSVVLAGGALYFPGRVNGVDGVYHLNLSTAAATALGPDPGAWRTLTGGGSDVYYISSDAAGRAVYRTDPADPSVRQRLIGDADGAPTPMSVFAAGGNVYAVCRAASDGHIELWRSGPTPGTAVKVADLQPGVPTVPTPSLDSGYFGFGRNALGATGTHLFFPMYRPETGMEPYKLALVAPPAVTASRFDVTGTDRQQVVLTFDDLIDPTTVQPSDFVVKNLTTGATVAAASLAATPNAAGNQITIRFPGYANGILPDGNYTLTLAAGAVAGTTGLPLAAKSVTPFFVLGGDANRDRTVGPEDFNLLAGHFSQTGQTWATGDFDYDGTVGPGDFNILASRFGTTLAPPASGLALSSVTPAATSTAVVKKSAAANPSAAVLDTPTRVLPRRPAASTTSALAVAGTVVVDPHARRSRP